MTGEEEEKTKKKKKKKREEERKKYRTRKREREKEREEERKKGRKEERKGSEVSLYHDVSTAPLLDLSRRLKLVVDLLSALIGCGVSLAKSVELAVLWDGRDLARRAHSSFYC